MCFFGYEWLHPIGYARDAQGLFDTVHLIVIKHNDCAVSHHAEIMQHSFGAVTTVDVGEICLYGCQKSFCGKSSIQSKPESGMLLLYGLQSGLGFFVTAVTLAVDLSRIGLGCGSFEEIKAMEFYIVMVLQALLHHVTATSTAMRAGLH